MRGIDLRASLNQKKFALGINDGYASYFENKIIAGENITFTPTTNLDGYTPTITVSGSASFATGGDVTGSSGAMNVVKLQGYNVSSEHPQDGYALVWDDVGDGYWRSTALSGDVVGTLTNNSVTKINGISITAQPTNGDALVFNGSDWVAGVVYTTGGDVYGDQITQYIQQLSGAENTGVVTIPDNVVFGFDGYIYLDAGLAKEVRVSTTDTTGATASADITIQTGSSEVSGTVTGNIKLVTGSNDDGVSGQVSINNDKVLTQKSIEVNLSSNQNNYDITDLKLASIVFINAVDGYNITGLKAITSNDILQKKIFNVGTGNITFKHSSGDSIAANRIIVPGAYDFVIELNDVVDIVYDITRSVWRLC